MQKGTTIGKIFVFRPLSPFILETVYEMRPCSNSYVPDRFVSLSMTLIDLERRDARGYLFWRISVRSLHRLTSSD